MLHGEWRWHYRMFFRARNFLSGLLCARKKLKQEAQLPQRNSASATHVFHDHLIWSPVRLATVTRPSHPCCVRLWKDSVFNFRFNFLSHSLRLSDRQTRWKTFRSSSSSYSSSSAIIYSPHTTMWVFKLSFIIMIHQTYGSRQRK